jgi:DNA/RNA-binding domain of Phe-tRNA-synthetase-like protein
MYTYNVILDCEENQATFFWSLEVHAESETQAIEALKEEVQLSSINYVVDEIELLSLSDQREIGVYKFSGRAYYG